mgnify:FL=1
MAENEYFKQALSSFAMDMASGGAIKHLTNQGYTVQQIVNKLDFPTPYEKVQELVWKQLIENGCLLLEEPGNGTEHEKVDYIQETDSLGRKSFRKVVVSCENDTRIHWKEWNYTWKSEDSFRAFLDERCVKNGEQDSYVRCDFGLRKYRDPKGYERTIQKLTAQQKEYILGLPWELRPVYHQLNLRMREIVATLYAAGEFHCCLYFRKTREKITLG